MTRKKPGLWLHRPKTKKRTATPSKSVTPKRWKPYTSQNDLYGKRQSASQNSTPNRQRMFSPCLQSFSPSAFPPLASCPELHVLVDSAIEKLKTIGRDQEFLNFLSLVKDEKFPLDNLSFLLFLETCRFYSKQHTSEMRYFEETKRFWKTGYRLFHAKFLYYMSGPRNVGQVMDSITTGSLSPEHALIIVAVPSIQTLSTFNIGDFDIPTQISPGVIDPILYSIGKSDGDAFMLCADGKKVTAGVDVKGGDVDMFGFEGGMPLAIKESIYENDKDLLDCVTSLVGPIENKTEITQR